jgi:photosystem II stability/assembly factor-like uncharacterized protein
VTLLDEQPRTTLGGTEADALIEEARRRQRRRWWSISIAVLFMAVAGGIAAYLGSPAKTPPPRSRTGTHTRISVAPGPTQAAAYLHVDWENVTGASGSLWLLGTYPCSAGTCYKILRSNDLGKTFVPVATPPIPRPTENAAVSLHFANNDDGYLYAWSSSKARLYWTGDGGKVWRLAQPGGTRVWRTVSLPIPFNSPVVTTNGRAYALVSEDCSKGYCRSLGLASSAVTSDTWTTTPLPPEAAESRVSMAAYGSKVWLITVQNGGGEVRLFVSDDGGRRFSSLPGTGMSALGCWVTATSTETLWGFCATGNEGFPVRSNNGGRDFAILSVAGRDSNGDNYVPVSDNVAVFQSPSPNVWLTRDGGQHFSSVLRSQNPQVGFTVAFASSNTWLALESSGVGESVAFWRTTNAGRTWHKVKPPRLKVKR